ncbi:RNA 3'-terminal phosphate cyclase [Rhodothermus profundi]|uniref:RNA 3'-terminal phosphate cyclase n=1 Tax=Rhodothermus profundi TaxID=633813 RepID=A0A1M6TR88_9BACT|nr:RNA 3'-terminal phosphate cyclase [Rhodothermus profundi]SHK59485.1 RNA 3'-terminal phosphate cyclase (ATP) [Rhodothermus profundi]
MSTPAPLSLDGSQHSGSGTLVRQAVALAALLGRPLHLYNIRARRQPPGLRPQHLKAVEAVAELVNARLEGARVGSQRLTFAPRSRPRGGVYRWDIGTAGSATLLVQTVLPVLAFADSPTRAIIRGGLFQDFAPTFFHLHHALLPLLSRMGLEARLTMQRPGYVPRGGGELLLEVTPLRAPLQPLRLEQQGHPIRVFGIALASHLKQRRVAERMALRCRQRLVEAGLPDPHIEIMNDTRAYQPGAALALFVETDTGALLGADQAGAPGRPSEVIADNVAHMLVEDLRCGATVDRHLADQLLPYVALAQGTSTYYLPMVTDHVISSCWLVEQLLGVSVQRQGQKLSVAGIAQQPAAAPPATR